MASICSLTLLREANQPLKLLRLDEDRLLAYKLRIGHGAAGAISVDHCDRQSVISCKLLVQVLSIKLGVVSLRRSM